MFKRLKIKFVNLRNVSTQNTYYINDIIRQKLKLFIITNTFKHSLFGKEPKILFSPIMEFLNNIQFIYTKDVIIIILLLNIYPTTH